MSATPTRYTGEDGWAVSTQRSCIHLQEMSGEASQDGQVRQPAGQNLAAMEIHDWNGQWHGSADGLAALFRVHPSKPAAELPHAAPGLAEQAGGQTYDLPQPHCRPGLGEIAFRFGLGTHVAFGQALQAR